MRFWQHFSATCKCWSTSLTAAARLMPHPLPTATLREWPYEQPADESKPHPYDRKLKGHKWDKTKAARQAAIEEKVRTAEGFFASALLPLSPQP